MTESLVKEELVIFFIATGYILILIFITELGFAEIGILLIYFLYGLIFVLTFGRPKIKEGGSGGG